MRVEERKCSLSNFWISSSPTSGVVVGSPNCRNVEIEQQMGPGWTVWCRIHLNRQERCPGEQKQLGRSLCRSPLIFCVLLFKLFRKMYHLVVKLLGMYA